MDSIRKAKNLKLLDSFRFVRICVRIPHPYLLQIKLKKSLTDLFKLPQSATVEVGNQWQSPNRFERGLDKVRSVYF